MSMLRSTAATLVFIGFAGIAVLGSALMEYSMATHDGCATAAFTGGTCYSTITFSQDIALGLFAPLLFVTALVLIFYVPVVQTLSPTRKKMRSRARAPDDSFVRWLALFELSPSR